MDWDRLRVFHAVVNAGSFTKAGRALDLSQSAISRQIGALEEMLGVALFHRPMHSSCIRKNFVTHGASQRCGIFCLIRRTGRESLRYPPPTGSQCRHGADTESSVVL